MGGRSEKKWMAGRFCLDSQRGKARGGGQFFRLFGGSTSRSLLLFRPNVLACVRRLSRFRLGSERSNENFFGCIIFRGPRPARRKGRFLKS